MVITRGDIGFANLFPDSVCVTFNDIEHTYDEVKKAIEDWQRDSDLLPVMIGERNMYKKGADKLEVTVKDLKEKINNVKDSNLEIINEKIELKENYKQLFGINQKNNDALEKISKYMHDVKSGHREWTTIPIEHILKLLEDDKK